MKKTDLFQMLEWYQNSGIPLALHSNPLHRFERLKTLQPESQYPMVSHPFTASFLKSSSESFTKEFLELNCKTLEDLKNTMAAFEECTLKQSAMNMVFADGNPKAKVMLVGEAPGAEEDKQARPFVGQSGQLLDKVLRSVGLNRDKVYISNIIPWRPPGNRPPTTQEIAVCEPFIARHIQLIKPKVLVLLGGVAAKTLLKSSEGIMKLRGNWQDYTVDSETKIKTMATFHPAYLMRSPGQKALVWRDFLEIQKKIETGED